jgi:hypothetical protein
LYNSRLFTRASVPLLVFEYTPFVLYPGSLLAVAYVMYKENKRVIEKLDSKYTPIWVRITEKQALLSK